MAIVIGKDEISNDIELYLEEEAGYGAIMLVARKKGTAYSQNILGINQDGSFFKCSNINIPGIMVYGSTERIYEACVSRESEDT